MVELREVLFSQLEVWTFSRHAENHYSNPQKVRIKTIVHCRVRPGDHAEQHLGGRMCMRHWHFTIKTPILQQIGINFWNNFEPRCTYYDRFRNPFMPTKGRAYVVPVPLKNSLCRKQSLLMIGGRFPAVLRSHLTLAGHTKIFLVINWSH